MQTNAPIHMLVKYSPADSANTAAMPVKLGGSSGGAVASQTPDIWGESIAIGFTGQVLLDSVDFKVERNVSATFNGQRLVDGMLDVDGDDDVEPSTLGAVALNASPKEFTFKKAMDLSTCQMLTALERQRPLDLTIRIAEVPVLDLDDLLNPLALLESGNRSFMTTISLNGATFLSYALEGDSGDKEASITETWTMRYLGIRVDYFPNAADAALTKLMRGKSSFFLPWKPGVIAQTPEEKDKDFEEHLIKMAASQMLRFEELVTKAREKGKKQRDESVFDDARDDD